jgi:hypothetical protein
VVWATVDGGQEWRRESGERWCSGKEIVTGMRSHEGKKECVSSSRMCSRSRRRQGHTETGAGDRRASWRLGRRRRNVGRAGAGQREVGKAAARQGKTRGTTQSGSGAVGAWHRAGKSSGDASGRGTEEAGAGGGRQGRVCDSPKLQGPHCNVLVTFKPKLKWKWAQKQKCRVYQNLQLCFKVRLQKR